MTTADFTVTVSTDLVRRRLADPVRCPPWDGPALRIAHVRTALVASELEGRPLPEGCADPHRHAARIAFLIRTGWGDPIEIDVGAPGLGYHSRWPVLDGNHRLAAAILMRKREILVSVSGDLDHATGLLGIQASLVEAHCAEEA